MKNAHGAYKIRTTDIVLGVLIAVVPTILLVVFGKGSAAHWAITFLFSIGIVTFVWATFEEAASGAPLYIKLSTYGALFMLGATFIMAVLDL